MRRRGVVGYFIAACLVRAADAAAIVGVVLLGRDEGLGGLTGVLAACLTIPHLAGPVVAQVLDRTRAKRAVISAAAALYGAAVLAAVALIGPAPFAAAASLLVAGACGPLLTGGLSSQLAGIVSDRPVALRRAQGMDALTYGVAGTAGPAAVGALAASLSPGAALTAAAAMAGVGAGAVWLIPVRVGENRRPVADSSVARSLSYLWRVPGLSRATVATAVTAIPLGAVPLIALATVETLERGPASLALLTAANAFGGFVVSLLLIAFPLRGEADRLVRYGTFAVVAALAAGAAIVGMPSAVVVFGVVGAATGLLFAASLAARTAYSPPGAQAQVFTSIAALKGVCGSLGTAVTGAVLPVGSAAIFLMATGLALLAALALLLDRRPPAAATS